MGEGFVSCSAGVSKVASVKVHVSCQCFYRLQQGVSMLKLGEGTSSDGGRKRTTRDPHSDCRRP
jgi:hypothetical protein